MWDWLQSMLPTPSVPQGVNPPPGFNPLAGAGAGTYPGTPDLAGPTGLGSTPLTGGPLPPPPIVAVPGGGPSPPITPTVMPPVRAPAGGMAGPGGPSIGESLAPTKPAGEPIPPSGGGGGPYGGAPGGPAPLPPTPVEQAKPLSGQPSQVPGALDKLAGVLRGVQAPGRPDVVKPVTPHGPPIQHIQGGNMLALMHTLYPGLAAGPSPAPPTTLGQSLGIGRY